MNVINLLYKHKKMDDLFQTEKVVIKQPHKKRVSPYQDHGRTKGQWPASRPRCYRLSLTPSLLAKTQSSLPSILLHRL